MSAKRLILVTVVIAALTVASGLLHGQITNRWGRSLTAQDAGRQLEQIPAEFGRWKQIETDTLDEQTLRMLQCDGYISRLYQHQDTGDSISLFVVVGPSSPISVHTPEVCFASRNHQQQGPRKTVDLTAEATSKQTFARVLFTAEDVHASSVLNYFAWHAGDGWQAPDGPRLAFLGFPFLYKLQIGMVVTSESPDDADRVAQQFLEDCTEAAQPHLLRPERPSLLSSLLSKI